MYRLVDAYLHFRGLLRTCKTYQIQQGLAQHMAFARGRFVAEGCENQIFNGVCCVHMAVVK